MEQMVCGSSSFLMLDPQASHITLWRGHTGQHVHPIQKFSEIADFGFFVCFLINNIQHEGVEQESGE